MNKKQEKALMAKIIEATHEFSVRNQFGIQPPILNGSEMKIVEALKTLTTSRKALTIAFGEVIGKNLFPALGYTGNIEFLIRFSAWIAEGNMGGYYSSGGLYITDPIKKTQGIKSDGNLSPYSYAGYRNQLRPATDEEIKNMVSDGQLNYLAKSLIFV